MRMTEDEYRSMMERQKSLVVGDGGAATKAKKPSKFPATGRGVRRKPGEMNKTEASYARHLDLQKIGGLVLDYWFEGITLKLAPDTRYTPDYLVLLSTLDLELHECKGHMEDDALVKLKVCAAMFPFRIMLVKSNRGVFDIREFGA